MSKIKLMETTWQDLYSQICQPCGWRFSDSGIAYGRANSSLPGIFTTQKELKRAKIYVRSQEVSRRETRTDFVVRTSQESSRKSKLPALSSTRAATKATLLDEESFRFISTIILQQHHLLFLHLHRAGIALKAWLVQEAGKKDPTAALCQNKDTFSKAMTFILLFFWLFF